MLNQVQEGRDEIFAKESRCDASRQSAQLWKSQSPLLCREISSGMVRSCDENLSGRIGKTRSAGYTHGKAAQMSTKDQVTWLHL